MTTEEKNELIVIEQKNALQVFTTENGLDPFIEEVRKQVEAEPSDPSTEEGRKAIGSLARKIGSQKQTFKKLGQALTTDWQAKTKAVTSETTRMEKELDALRDQVLKPRQEFEEKRQARIDDLENRIIAMADTANFEHFKDPDADELNDAIITLNKLFCVDFDNTAMQWDEFLARATTTHDTTRNRLNGMLSKRKEYDKEQAELKRLQEEEAQRKAKEDHERIAREATREAEDKAEKEKIIAKENAEKDKSAAIAAERQRQVDEVNENNAKIAEQKRIDEARAADKEHRKNIIASAHASLAEVCVCSEGTSSLISREFIASQVLKAIISGDIPNVTIKF